MNSTEIKLGEKKHTISKMNWSKYEELTAFLAGLSQKQAVLEALESDKGGELLSTLPAQVTQALAIATGIKAETIREAWPEQVIDMFEATIKLNNIVELIGRTKKAVSLLMAQAKKEIN